MKLTLSEFTITKFAREIQQKLGTLIEAAASTSGVEANILMLPDTRIAEGEKLCAAAFVWLLVVDQKVVRFAQLHDAETDYGLTLVNLGETKWGHIQHTMKGITYLPKDFPYTRIKFDEEGVTKAAQAILQFMVYGIKS